RSSLDADLHARPRIRNGAHPPTRSSRTTGHGARALEPAASRAGRGASSRGLRLARGLEVGADSAVVVGPLRDLGAEGAADHRRRYARPVVSEPPNVRGFQPALSDRPAGRLALP